MKRPTREEIGQALRATGRAAAAVARGAADVLAFVAAIAGGDSHDDAKRTLDRIAEDIERLPEAERTAAWREVCAALDRAHDDVEGRLKARSVDPDD